MRIKRTFLFVFAFICFIFTSAQPGAIPFGESHYIGHDPGPTAKDYMEYYEKLLKHYKILYHYSTNRPCYDFATSSAPALHHSGAGGSTFMNHYTGTMTTSIPLVPGVSLSYTASGIRVDQIASWVGLGWQLNVGGVITRTVKGYPDESRFFHQDPNGNNHYISGWKTNPYPSGSSWTSVGDRVQNFNPSPSNRKDLAEALEDFNGLVNLIGPDWGECHKEDTESDDFHFSFPGGGGKFILDDSPVVYTQNPETWNEGAFLMPHSKLKVLFTMNGTPGQFDETSKYIDQFKLIDANGTEYLYDALEFVTSTTQIPQTDQEYIGGPPAGSFVDQTLHYGTYVQSWFLTKITSASGEVIEFTYADEEIRLEEGFYEVYRGFNNDQNDSPEYTLERNVEVQEPNNSTIITPKVETKRLTQISGKDFMIKFESDLVREDLFTAGISNTDKPKALSQINYFAKTGNDLELLKQVQLFYSYFQTDANINAALDFSQYIYTNESYTLKRLRLDAVQVLNGDEILPPYEFTYYDEYNNNDNWLPARYSYCQDLWGFFNSVEETTTLIPAMDVDENETGYERFDIFPGLNPELPGADRQASSNSSIVNIGSLEEIKLPEGGSYEYEYEPNDFIYDGSKRVGGGLRLKKITKSEGTASNSIETNFSYIDPSSNNQSSGLPITLPVYGYFDPTNIDNCTYINTPWDAKYNDFYVRTPFNMLEMSEGSVGYSKVFVEKYGGETGKTEYVYNNEATYGDYSSASQSLFSTSSSVNVPSVLDIETYNEDPVPKDTKEKLTGLDFGVHSYPYAPNTNYNWWRGNLEKINYYDNNYTNPVETIENTYSVFEPPQGEAAIYGLKVASLRNNMPPDNVSCPDLALSPLHVCSKYIKYADIKTVQDESVRKTFINGSTSEYVDQNTEYEYNDYGQISRTSTTQSDNSIIISTFKYAQDILDELTVVPTSSTDEVTNAIINMSEKNMYNYPVETLLLKKENENAAEKVISASVTTYKIQALSNNGNTDVPLPYETYILEPTSPIDLANNFTEVYIDPQDYSFNIDAEYTTTPKIKLHYDDFGNVILVEQENQLPKSTLYKYDDKRVSAEAINAHPEEILCEDFEYFSEVSSLWTNVGSHAICTTDSKGGNMCVSLNNNSYLKKSFQFLSGAPYYVGQKGYKASVWVKGSSNARIHVQLNNSPAIVRTASSTSSTEWNLLEVSFTEAEIESLQLPITVYVTIENINTIPETVYFDDVRFSPSDCILTCYSYDLGGHLLSLSDANNQYIYYDYDGLGRQIVSRDDNKNIISFKDFNIGNPADFTYYLPNPTDTYLRNPILVKDEDIRIIPNYYDTGTTYQVRWEASGNFVNYTGPGTIIHDYDDPGEYEVTLKFTLDGIEYTRTRTILVN